jgi:hypothetical protein
LSINRVPDHHEELKDGGIKVPAQPSTKTNPNKAIVDTPNINTNGKEALQIHVP